MGSGDMLEVAHMGLHVAQMTGLDAMHQCFLAVTETPARILGLAGYGLAPGCHADLVVLDAGSTVEAIRLRAARRMVLRRGQVVAEGPRTRSRLFLPERPGQVDFRQASQSAHDT
jgi:cytosine deaminase